MFENKIPKKVIDLITLVQKHGYEIYLVGGCVRDLIMGLEPHDWDMCTNADPLEMIDMFEKEHLSINPKGLAFGTVTVWFDNEEFEITTYREELSYVDGRHPDSVSFVKNIETDLARRDFTINAIAYNPVTDKLCDCFGGVEDIKNGCIRCVGNADTRLSEDGLRILRALRFAIKFGFYIHKETESAMYYNLDMLNNVSKERITQELEKILISGKPIKDHFLRYSWVITKIIPSIEPCVGFEQNNKYHKHNVYEHCLAVVDLCKTNDFIIKLAALLHDIGKPVAYVTDEQGNGHFYGHPENSFEIVKDIVLTDLRLTTIQKNTLLDLVLYHDMMVSSSKKSARRLLNKFGESFLSDWLILKQADIDDHVFSEELKPDWVSLDDFKMALKDVLLEESCFKIKDLAVNGLDIMNELHIKQGKEVGQVLEKLLDFVISEEVENTRENLLKIAHTCL